MQEYLHQLSEFWSKLGINQKVSITLAGLFVVIGMSAILTWNQSSDMKVLYSNLDGSDISEIIEALDDKGVPYEVGLAGNSIMVPSEKVYSLRMEMAMRGIPNGGGVGFEIFDKSNFGVSDFVQRTNYLRALQGELSRTVTQLRGVKSARVMITMPENKILAEKAGNRAKASVFVDTGGLELSNEAVNSIRFLVANAIEGLKTNEVAVVDNHGNVLSSRLGDEGALGSAGQMRYRKEAESYFRNKIEALLIPVVGRGNVVAQVSVDINSETLTSFKEEFDPEGQVVRTQTINEDNVSSTELTGGTLVGVAGNTPAQEDIGTGRPESSTQESRKNKTINYEINRQTTELVRTPGTIESITASVFVSDKVAGLGADKLDSIRHIVMTAIGIKDTEEGARAITIEQMPFVDQSVNVESVPEGGMWEVPQSIYQWVELGRNFVGAGVAVVVFIVFLRLLKKSKPSSVEVELLPEGQAAGNVNEAMNVNSKPSAELINELIDQRPDNISIALKNWVSSQNK